LRYVLEGKFAAVSKANLGTGRAQKTGRDDRNLGLRGKIRRLYTAHLAFTRGDTKFEHNRGPGGNTVRPLAGSLREPVVLRIERTGSWVR